MAIYEILEQQNDSAEYSYNGSLGAYLETEPELDDSVREAFARIAETDPETKIIVDLKGAVKLDAISNRIIHYRDIGKLQGNPVVYPYILYVKDDNGDRAMLVVPYEPYGYLYARGYYYCLSEAGSQFYDVRNEVLEVCTGSSDEIVNSWDRLRQEKAGMIQRQLDRRHFRNYDELKQQAMEAAEALKAKAAEVLPEIVERGDLIRYYIVRWFLLKKVLYVQYMVNKNIRSSAHDGDIHKQRNQARINADEVPILSYRQMWTLGQEEEEPVEEAPAEESAEAAEQPELA